MLGEKLCTSGLIHVSLYTNWTKYISRHWKLYAFFTFPYIIERYLGKTIKKRGAFLHTVRFAGDTKWDVTWQEMGSVVCYFIMDNCLMTSDFQKELWQIYEEPYSYAKDNEDKIEITRSVLLMKKNYDYDWTSDRIIQLRYYYDETFNRIFNFWKE